GGVSSSQRDLLKAVAEGRGDQAACGTTPIATDDAQGVYLPASDPAALQFLFAQAGALVAGGSPDAQVECPSSACPRGVYQLAVDPGVAGVRVVIRSSGLVALQSPGGQTVQMTGGSSTVGNATVNVLRRDGLTTVNLGFSGGTTKPA